MTKGDVRSWEFHKIGLVVTGDGEAAFLCDFFKSLMATGRVGFETIRKAGQRKERSPKQLAALGRQGKSIPGRDAELAVEIRRYVAEDKNQFAIWVDDLETKSRPNAAQKFARMKLALDKLLGPYPELRSRASVHFLVNMLEAYYFSDTAAVNHILAINLSNHDGDCENIHHPKDELKRLAKQANQSFREIDHGAEIVPCLNLETILANPNHCRALRTLVAWCYEAIGEPRTETFCLTNGTYWDITSSQLSETPPHVDPLGEETAYCPLAS